MVNLLEEKCDRNKGKMWGKCDGGTKGWPTKSWGHPVKLGVNKKERALVPKGQKRKIETFCGKKKGKVQYNLLGPTKFGGKSKVTQVT